jgi:hypothetical protein
MAIVKLAFPIENGTEKVVQLEIRKPLAGDLRGMGRDMGMDEMMTLASRCSGYPPSVIEKLDLSDFQKVAEVLGNFMEAGLQTGQPR